jgi:hypothetical protein
MSGNNEQGSAFGLHGIGGALIATVLLLSILAVFTVMGLGVQQDNADNYYDIPKVKELTMINDGKTSADFIVDVPAPAAK